MLRKGSWPRLILTSLVLAILLTGISDQSAGKHNAPVYDWIIFGVLIVAIRLAYRAIARRIRRRPTTATAAESEQPGLPE